MADYRYEFTHEIALDQLQRLFSQTEWTWRRTPEGLQAMLAYSRICLGVWEGERLVGFARAITDDVYRASLEDIIVDQDYQVKGIGTEIMHRLLARLEHVEEISLNCDDRLVPFYERFGFTRFTMTHMHLWKGT